MKAAQVTDKFLALVDGYLRAGALATPSMGLFINTPTLSEATLLADLTQPVYTGYALFPLILEAVRKDLLGNYIESYGSAHFQATALIPPAVTVNGYFVQATITAVDYLLYAEYFDTPIVLADTFSALDVLFDGMVVNQKTWGGYCATC